MKKNVIIKCIFLIFILLYACKSKNTEESKIYGKLDKINLISESNPDSAYYLLNQIEQDNLTPDLNFRYDLLKIKLKAYLDMDINQDSIAIKHIKNYFLTGSSDSLIASSYYYAGIIYFEANNFEKATENFLKSNEYSKTIITIKAKSQNFLGNINYNLGFYEEAKKWYKESYKTSFQFNKNRAISSLVSVGNCFLLNYQPDSAMIYYQKAVELHNQINNNGDISFLNNIIVALCQNDEFVEAKKLCMPLLKDSSNIKSTEDKHFLYMNMVDIYYHTENTDSALYFINKVKELKLEDLDKQMAMYHLWYLTEQKSGNLKQALEAYKSYHKSEKEYLKERSNLKILEIQEKFDNEKYINEKNKIVFSKKKNEFFISIIIITLLLLLFFIMYLLKKTQLAKKTVEIEKLIKEEENKQFENEIYTLKKIIENKEESVQWLSNLQIDTIKRFTTLGKKKTQIEMKSEFEKFLKKIDLNFLISIIKRIDLDYHKEFTKKYPFINESDLIICYLVFLGFENEQISLILNFSENTIQQRKVSIRKKFGLNEREKIKQFVENDFRLLQTD